MNKDNFYINDLSEIRAFCINSDKEDVYKYIYCLQQENQASKQTINELSNKIAKLVEEKNKLKSELKASNKGLQEVSTRSLKYKTKYFNSEHIIDELEKWLKENKYFYSGLQGEDLEEDTTIIEVLNKLQELKGIDKE